MLVVRKVKFTLLEWKYWNIDRKTQNFIPWVARKLPKRIKYFVVIDGMTTVEPNEDPQGVSGMQLLDLWSERKEYHGDYLEHEWEHIEFTFGGYLQCKCGYRPNSQEEMDAHR